MILFGAGASVPLGIPTMEEFVRKFEMEISRSGLLKDFYDQIKLSITKAREFTGQDWTFDLESLMAVLEDIAGVEKISISQPTIAFISYQLKSGKLQDWSIKESRMMFGYLAKEMLKKLRYFVVKACTEPITKIECGELNRYYGPIFTLLGKSAARTVFSSVNQWIFTTNWDICLKAWLECIGEEFDDGFVLDRSRKTILNPHTGWQGKRFNLIHLHGSIDSVKVERSRIGGRYEDILKVPGPYTYLLHYFKSNPEEIERIFMIYPLEAVGYENSVRSPYLDMLNILRNVFMRENVIFVIGFSFRDVTVSSIFEDVLRVKAERNEWFPIKTRKLENRAKKTRNMQLKFVIVDPNPEKILKNLEKQGFYNIQKACIPVKAKLPKIDSSRFAEEYSLFLTSVGEKLVEMGYMSSSTLQDVFKSIRESYGLPLPAVTES